MKESGRYRRIRYRLKFDPDPDKMDDAEKPQQEDGEEDDHYYERIWDWERDIRRAVQPEPGKFKPPTAGGEGPFSGKFYHTATMTWRPIQGVDLVRDYKHRGLQVIVKLANIELTPEHPEYEGGTVSDFRSY